MSKLPRDILIRLVIVSVLFLTIVVLAILLATGRDNGVPTAPGPLTPSPSVSPTTA